MEFNKAWAGFSAPKNLFSSSLPPIRSYHQFQCSCDQSLRNQPRVRQETYGRGKGLDPHPEPPSTALPSPPAFPAGEIQSSHSHTHVHMQAQKMQFHAQLWCLLTNFFFQRLKREINIGANSIRDVSLSFSFSQEVLGWGGRGGK